MSWQEKINAALDARRAADALRRRYPVAQGAGRWLVADDRQYLNFSSNDYLGLSHHPQIIRAWQQGAEQFGIGSGGSGHVSGYSVVHQALEEELAEWLGYSRALLFISGFAANQAVIAAMMAKEDRIAADRLSHASLLEAASLSPSQLRRFAHNDVTHLARLLASPCPGQQMVVTEGVFSMDGDSAPLAEIQQVTQQHNGWLMVDDAHGTGVIGEQGRGSCWLQKGKTRIAGSDFWQRIWRQRGSGALLQYGGGLSAAIRPPPYLQHQYAARSGAGITCVAGGHSQ